MRFNRKQFFDSYRNAFGALNQTQVVGLEFLLGEIEKDAAWKRVEEIAYVLATAQHETAHTFQPIKEYRARAGTKARRVQDAYWGTGFYGRGFVQLTHELNYRHYGIASDPDKALEPAKAYEILSDGMRQGVFTKRKLSDFINDSEVDYTEARTIVNGHDKAQQIADNARRFERILKASLVTDSVTEPKLAEPNKGTTTGMNSADETAGTPPPAPAVEVKASEVPFWTRVTSISIPAGVVSAIGAVIAFAKDLPPYAWVAFSVIVVAGMVIGYLVWKDGKSEAHERTKIVMSAAADRDRNNLRLI